MPKINNKLLFTLISLAFLLPNFSDAYTQIPQSYINEHIIWTKDNSPYLITQDLDIGINGVLDIEEGVEVRVRNGRKITNWGSININGTDFEKVKITADGDDNSENFPYSFSDKWGGVIFKIGSKGELNNTDFRYSNTGISNEGGEIDINNTLFFKNSNVINQKSGTTTSDRNIFNESDTAITLEGGFLSIQNSKVENSKSYAFISYDNNPGKFFAKNNVFINNKYNPFLDIAIDFDISSTTFIGGDALAWRVGGDLYGDKVIPEDLYILNGIFAHIGSIVTIKSGTVFKGQQGGGFYARGGVINFDGEESKPIIFTSITDDSILGDTNNDGSNTENGSLKTGGIIVETLGEVNISNTKIKNAKGGTFIGPFNPIYGSIINFGGNLIANNIEIEDGQNTAIHQRGGTSDIEKLAIKSGFYENLLVYDYGDLNIHNSSFEGNISYHSLLNRENIGIPDVRNNWWGASEGPFHPTNQTGTAPPIGGNALFIPFLTSDPFLNTIEECCSSVLFIPGFMASDLYVQGTISENQLWPPNSLLKTDVEKLMLDDSGNSITPGIYTKGPLSEVFGLNVYKSFIQKMDQSVESGDIREWLAFPYDWRKDINEIVNNYTTIKKGGDFENKKLIDEAIALAQRSPTGKITIIAHSNGGLIGKSLIKALVDAGKGEVVDKIIMVAVPQVGTPKAIASLLHGDQQEILWGLLLDKELARSLGHNMQSAHNLLPSQKYFDAVSDPVINFQNSISQIFDYSINGFPQSISTDEKMANFLTLTNRGLVVEQNTNVPSSLKSSLVNNANASVNTLNNFIIPSNIEVYEIAGWGENTIKNVSYKSKKENTCSSQNGLYTCQAQSVWDRELVMTRDGDGTVVVPSATIQNTADEYYLNLFDRNKSVGTNLKHHNILETNSILTLISQIFTDTTSNEALPQYISLQKPITQAKSLRLSVHSPISIGVSDTQGKFTGINSTQTNDSFTFVKEEIPNSYYLEIAEDKYIGLDIDSDYQVNMQGNGVGTFTFDQEIIDNGNVIEKKSFINIPVTPLTEVSLFIDNGVLSDNINVDVDGNGTTEIQIKSNNQFNPIDYLSVMKFVIKSFGLERSQETDLVTKIDNLIKSIQSGQIQKASSKAEVFVKKLNLKLAKIDEGESPNRKLTIEEMTIIIQNLEEFILNLK